MSKRKEHTACPALHREGGRIKLSGIYRIFLGRRQNQNIWIVDGEKVCLQLFPDFIMGGNDQRYRFNPPDDVWIDNRIGVEELEYTIAHELMRERGWSYNRAHEEGGLAVERVMRERNARKVALRSAIYRAYYGKRQGLEVWIVDGPRVRLELDPDFCFAAHDFKSKYVPKGEIWLDSAMSCEEAVHALRQQIAERKLLAAGMRWPHAYEKAQNTVLAERRRQARLAARHEATLPCVSYGVRERGVKPKGTRPS
jgi:hypothetical protein